MENDNQKFGLIQSDKQLWNEKVKGGKTRVESGAILNLSLRSLALDVDLEKDFEYMRVKFVQNDPTNIQTVFASQNRLPAPYTKVLPPGTLTINNSASVKGETVICKEVFSNNVFYVTDNLFDTYKTFEITEFTGETSDPIMFNDSTFAVIGDIGEAFYYMLVVDVDSGAVVGNFNTTYPIAFIFVSATAHNGMPYFALRDSDVNPQSFLTFLSPQLGIQITNVPLAVSGSGFELGGIASFNNNLVLFNNILNSGSLTTIYSTNDGYTWLEGYIGGNGTFLIDVKKRGDVLYALFQNVSTYGYRLLLSVDGIDFDASNNSLTNDCGGFYVKDNSMYFLLTNGQCFVSTPILATPVRNVKGDFDSSPVYHVAQLDGNNIIVEGGFEFNRGLYLNDFPFDSIVYDSCNNTYFFTKEFIQKIMDIEYEMFFTTQAICNVSIESLLLNSPV